MAVGYPAARLSFRYDAPSTSYAISQDGVVLHGTDGRLESANILVQHIQSVDSGFVDVLGNPTPANVTTGSEPATLYRNAGFVPDTHTVVLSVRTSAGP